MREIAYPTVKNTLLKVFLIPMEITQYNFAKKIRVPQAAIAEIAPGKQAITVNTGLGLAEILTNIKPLELDAT